MNSEYAGLLARQFGFEEWSRPEGAQAENLLVWRFTPRGMELSGWRLHRAERGAGAGGAANVVGETDAAVVSDTHSLWLDGAERGGSMLRVDTWECATQEAARHRLLALLGEHQGASIFTRSRDGAGEVAFSAPNDHAQMFARGNLVVEVRNASRQLTAVSGPARELDALLLARPDPVQAEALGIRAGEVSPAELASFAERVAADASDQPDVWFKFFARGGEVVLEGGRPVFRARRDEKEPGAEPRLTAYVVGLPRSRPGPERDFAPGG